jgi:hypothetical protein
MRWRVGVSIEARLEASVLASTSGCPTPGVRDLLHTRREVGVGVSIEARLEASVLASTSGCPTPGVRDLLHTRREVAPYDVLPLQPGDLTEPKPGEDGEADHERHPLLPTHTGDEPVEFVRREQPVVPLALAGLLLAPERLAGVDRDDIREHGVVEDAAQGRQYLVNWTGRMRL